MLMRRTGQASLRLKDGYGWHLAFDCMDPLQIFEKRALPIFG